MTFDAQPPIQLPPDGDDQPAAAIDASGSPTRVDPSREAGAPLLSVNSLNAPQIPGGDLSPEALKTWSDQSFVDYSITPVHWEPTAPQAPRPAGSDAPQLATGGLDSSRPEALKTWSDADFVDRSVNTYHVHGVAPVTLHAEMTMMSILLAVSPVAEAHVDEVDAIIDALNHIADYARKIPRDELGQFATLTEGQAIARRLEKQVPWTSVPELSYLFSGVDLLTKYEAELTQGEKDGRDDARHHAIRTAVLDTVGEAVGSEIGVDVGVMALPLIAAAGPVVSIGVVAGLGWGGSKLMGLLMKEVNMRLDVASSPGDLNAAAMSALAGTPAFMVAR